MAADYTFEHGLEQIRLRSTGGRNWGRPLTNAELSRELWYRDSIRKADGSVMTFGELADLSYTTSDTELY